MIRTCLLLAAAASAWAAEPRWMISMSAIRHLNGTGEPTARFFAGPGNFIMNGTKGAADFPPGFQAAPTATFPSYAAMREALDAGRLPKEVRAVIYDNESW